MTQTKKEVWTEVNSVTVTPLIPILYFARIQIL